MCYKPAMFHIAGHSHIFPSQFEKVFGNFHFIGTLHLEPENKRGGISLIFIPDIFIIIDSDGSQSSQRIKSIASYIFFSLKVIVLFLFHFLKILSCYNLKSFSFNIPYTDIIPRYNKMPFPFGKFSIQHQGTNIGRCNKIPCSGSM